MTPDGQTLLGNLASVDLQIKIDNRTALILGGVVAGAVFIGMVLGALFKKLID